MNRFQSFLFLLFGLSIVLFLQSCKTEGCTNPESSNYNPDATTDDGSCILPDEGTFTFNLSVKVAGQEFEIGKDYVTQAGSRMKFDQLKFFLSRVELVANDNSTYPLILVDLLDFSNTGNYSLEVEKVPAGEYKGLRLGIGLDDSLNALDPSTFSSEHPLSSLTNMYWSWLSKYIFVKVDGFGDEDQTGSYSTFIYHTGLDSLYRTVELFDHPFTLLPQGNASSNISLDFEDIFYNPTDSLKFWDVSENFTHTTGNFDLAERFQDNFVAAIKEE